jgi:hypothetical protein
MRDFRAMVVNDVVNNFCQLFTLVPFISPAVDLQIARFACPEDYSKISSVLSLIARDML